MISHYLVEYEHRHAEQLKILLRGVAEELKTLRHLLNGNAKDSPVRCLTQEIQLKLIDKEKNREQIPRSYMWTNFTGTTDRSFPGIINKQKEKVSEDVRDLSYISGAQLTVGRLTRVVVTGTSSNEYLG
jgi:hypothetical protein